MSSPRTTGEPIHGRSRPRLALFALACCSAALAASYVLALKVLRDLMSLLN
jgi:hypothetical protein